MTLSRRALYGGGGALLVAYLAAANMPPATDAASAKSRAQASREPSTDAIASDVRAQADRLHERMKTAPVPQTNQRNPFSFGLAEPRPRAATTVRAATVAEPPPLPAIPSPPLLTLMGIAEETLPQGVRRTAIIGGDGNALFMVTEGQAVGDRYKVTKIGADAVELEDLLTKAYRRLALR
jgi:hypothetical protein